MPKNAAFWPIAPCDDIPVGACRPFEAGGVPIVVAHLGDGFHAIENRCTHLNSRLMTSRIYRGRLIACPIHGAHFDLKTGQAKSPPAFRPVKVFPVRIADGTVEVAVGELPSDDAGDQVYGERQNDRVEEE